MGATSSIEYVDSSVNPINGCEGCELWNEAQEIRDCYAGVQTQHYKGRPGWADDFNYPKYFPGRLEKALGWTDLSGKERPDKPWLNGFPRIIFVNDMSDGFGKVVPPETWLSPYLPRMMASPHIWLMLTKRAGGMRDYFWKTMGGFVPDNFWLGVTVTSPETLPRLTTLEMMKQDATQEGSNAVFWCSFEPLLKPVIIGERWNRPDGPMAVDWAVLGGMSNSPRPTQPRWLTGLAEEILSYDIPLFFKQWGSDLSNPHLASDPTAKTNGGATKGGRTIFGRSLTFMPELRKREQSDE